MRPNITFALTAVLAITLTSCGKHQEAPKYTYVSVDTIPSEPKWLQELKRINKLRDDTNYISVYFKCENRYFYIHDVYGIIYPEHNESDKDNGWQGWSPVTDAIMMLHNPIAGYKYLMLSNDTKNHTFHHLVIDLNTLKICNDSTFTGFRSGDVYTFHYHNENDTEYLNELYETRHPIYNKNNYDGQNITMYKIVRTNETGLVLEDQTDTIIYNFE